MKTKLFVFFSLGLSIILLSCGEKSKYQHLIGKQYRSLDEFPEMAAFADGGGSLIGRVKKVDYVITYYYRDTTHLIAFEKISKKVKGKSQFRLLDILEITDMEEGQLVTFAECRMNGEKDPELIAIYQDADKGVEYYQDITRAWRANRETLKIEPIEVSGIDCRNKVFGM